MDWLKDRLNNTKIDFVGKRRIATVMSAVGVALSLLLFFTWGPNWGIDFTGGTEIHLKFDQQLEIRELRGALRDIGLPDDAVQRVGAEEDAEFTIRIQDASFGADEAREQVVSRLEQRFGQDWVEHVEFTSEVGARLTVRYGGDAVPMAEVRSALDDLANVQVQEGRDWNQVIVTLPGLSRQVEAQIREVMGERTFQTLSIDAVGPKVGGELRRQAFVAIFATLGLVLLYVAFRFDIAFAPGAILALFHDVVLTLGVFVLLQKEINLPMIGALLTIVGYSLNDTIVIYDRIRENMDRYRRTDLPDLINVSINETLSRTIATSTTTFLAISAFLVMGGPVIEDFAFAMLCGIVFGTYSTVFVASPVILVMQDVKPALSRLVAAGGASDTRPPMVHDEEEGPPGTLTESEKRRRERAERERKNLPGAT